MNFSQLDGPVASMVPPGLPQPTKHGKSILEHMGDEVAALGRQMRAALPDDCVIDEEELKVLLQLSEAHESLRLIASAYRENLHAEDPRRFFRVQSGGWQVRAWSTSSALALRSPTALPDGLLSIFYVDGSKEYELIGVDGVLIALRPALERCEPAPSSDSWRRFLRASHQSVRNEAMARLYKQAWGARLLRAIGRDGGIFAHLGRTDVSVYRIFNQLAAFDARPVTPFSKMKLDLSADAVLAHSPEFTQNVPLTFAAMRRSCARLPVAQELKEFDRAFEQLFPGVRASFDAELARLGRAGRDYVPVPLHPLNESWIRANLQDLLMRGELVLLSEFRLDSAPSLSFRSMLTSTHCLKLPVPVQTTHLIRNLALREIEFGPLCSDVFHRILYEEGLANRLVLERDVLGAYIDPESVGVSSDVAAMVGFVSRQDPDQLVARDEHVLPVAGLFAQVPGSRGMFFFDILRHLDVIGEDKVYEYFSDYVELIVGTQLELFFKTGLMPEAHQQNLNLVFDADWRLRRLMYHDIPGGVAAYLPLLTARHDVPEAMVRTLRFFRDEPKRSIFQFIHPTLTAHFRPLMQEMARFLNVSRTRLVRIVRDRIEAEILRGRAVVARSAAEHAARQVLIGEFEATVLKSPTLPGKMMLGRLYMQSLNPEWGEKVPNPELLSARALIAPCDARNFLRVSGNAAM